MTDQQHAEGREIVELLLAPIHDALCKEDSMFVELFNETERLAMVRAAATAAFASLRQQPQPVAEVAMILENRNEILAERVARLEEDLEAAQTLLAPANGVAGGELGELADYLDRLEGQMLAADADMMVDEATPPSVWADRLRAILALAPPDEAAIRADERERCAEIADAEVSTNRAERFEMLRSKPEDCAYYLWAEQSANRIAAAIRALPPKPAPLVKQETR